MKVLEKLLKQAAAESVGLIGAVKREKTVIQS